MALNEGCAASDCVVASQEKSANNCDSLLHRHIHTHMHRDMQRDRQRDESSSPCKLSSQQKFRFASYVASKIHFDLFTEDEGSKDH